MKVSLIPNTKSGRYSLIFMLLSFILVVLINIIAINLDTIENSNNSFFGNAPLAIMTLSVFASAIISLLTGLIATIKNKERSVLVFICILAGILVVYFGIAQIIGEITNTYWIWLYNWSIKLQIFKMQSYSIGTKLSKI